MGDYDAAQPLYERAVPVARRLAVPELRWRAAFGLRAHVPSSAQQTPGVLALYRDSVATLEEPGRPVPGDDALREQYLAADNRLLAYDGLTRVLWSCTDAIRARATIATPGAVLEARKGRVVAGRRWPRRVPRYAIRLPGRRPSRVRTRAADARARGGPARGAGDERRRRARKRLEASRPCWPRRKAEYLAQVQAFLARYPQYKAQFVDQQTVDPKALAQVRRPAAIRDAGHPVLHAAARHALPLRRRARRQLPGAQPGDRAGRPLHSW